MRIAITEHTANRFDRRKSRESLLKTLNLVRQEDADYVLQGRKCIPYFLKEKPQLDADPGDLIDESERCMQEEIVLRRGRYFTCIPDWLEFYRSRDFVLGTRVHGAILALQAGVPSILVTHENRTAGLAHSLSIPSMTQDDFLQWNGDWQRLLELSARQWKASIPGDSHCRQGGEVFSSPKTSISQIT